MADQRVDDSLMTSGTESSLIRINALLNEAQQMAGVGAWELDVASGKTFWSEEVYRIYEVSRDFDHNRSEGVRFYAEEDQRILEESLCRAVRKAENFTLTCRFISAKGTHKWVKVSGKPEILDGTAVRVLGVIQDISETKRKEAEVLQSVSFSESLMFAMQDGLTIVSLTGVQLNVNPGFCRMVGFSEHELVGQKPPFAYWPAEELERITDAFNQRIHDGLSHNLRFCRKNGERFPVIVSPSVLRNAEGHPIATFATVKDISAQVRREEQLRQLALVAANTTDSVILTDAPGNIIWVNEAFTQLSGFTLLEVVGRRPGAILQGPDTDPETIRYMSECLRRQESISVEVLNYAKNGTSYWLDLNINPVFDDAGKLEYFIAIERDITDKHREKELLQASLDDATTARRLHDEVLEELQKLTNSAPGAIFQVQRVGGEVLKFTYVSNGISRIDPRLTPDSLLHELDGTITEMIGQSQVDMMMTEMMASAENLTPVQFDLKLEHPEHSRWVQVDARPQKNEKGEIIWYGYVRDITEARNHQLTLENMLHLTSDQNSRLLSFTQIVSHNIRSHASNITGLLGLMDFSRGEHEREHYVDLLKDSAEKLDETLHNLNEVLSIQSKVKIPRKCLNLRREINTVLNTLAFDIKQHLVFTKNEVSPTVLLSVVPAYLESIILNLTTNAIKYRSAERRPCIIYRASVTDKHIIVEVEDNGLGLDLRKYRKNVFSMYKTFHGNEDAKGLGLFLVKNQVEAMQGTISVDSEVGVGSTFRVTFPRT